jgi:2-methylisocitrate lyase-like PEP mutase family enzyme
MLDGGGVHGAHERRVRLRGLLAEDRLVVCPGVSAAIYARLAEHSGFELLFATGAGIANSQFGVPDLGLVTMTEQLAAVRQIVQATALPVIADADTGYGGTLNVYRTVLEFEAAGVAAVQLEDQLNPKRCGHFDDKKVVAADEMLERIAAARQARQDDELVLVCRTDAIAITGFADAIDRANAYAEAGADLIFVEAPTTQKEIALIPREVAAPVLLNIVEGGRTPTMSIQRLEQLGYRVALYANTVLRVALAAAAQAFDALRRTGSTAEVADLMMGWRERQDLVQLPEWRRISEVLARAVEPDEPDEPDEVAGGASRRSG